ncbi:MAG: DegT/DnrJ/EryC1/StrS family aminotransferase [Faecalibacillus sp.]
MTDIMAGIGLAQLDKYQKLLSRRKEIIYKYNEGLKDLDVQILNHYDENHNSSGHLYLVRINGISGEQRNEIITDGKKGIACNVHYKPLPLLTAYKKLGFDIKDYPNAYNQFINEVTLPLHTKLSDDDINYILKKLCELL